MWRTAFSASRDWEEPVDFAGERDVPVVHGGLHAVGNRAPQLQRANDVGCDIRVGAFQFEPHLDIVRDGAHAANTLGSALGGQLARIAVDIASERDGATLRRNPYPARVHLRIPLELPQHRIPHVDVRVGQTCS
jgi:hypothetical protein